MKVKGLSGYSMKFYQPVFGKRPKGFNSVNVAFAPDKFISTMIYPIVFFVTQIHQAIITSPLIRMDNAFRGNSASYYLPCSVALAQSGTISALSSYVFVDRRFVYPLMVDLL